MPDEPKRTLADYVFQTVIGCVKALDQAHGSYIAIQNKLIEMARDGAFICDCYDTHAKPVATDKTVSGIWNWAICSDQKEIGIQLVLSHVDSDPWDDDPYSVTFQDDDWYTCPVSWLFMTREEYIPLAKNRLDFLTHRREQKEREAAKAERRERYYKMKPEFEELRKEFEPEEKGAESK